MRSGSRRSCETAYENWRSSSVWRVSSLRRRDRKSSIVACRFCASASNRAIRSAAESRAFCSGALIDLRPSQYRSSGADSAQLAVAVLVILRVVLQVFARAYMLNPFLIHTVPVHGRLQAGFEIRERTPAGLLH